MVRNRVQIWASMLTLVASGLALAGTAQADPGDDLALAAPLVLVAHCANRDTIELEWGSIGLADDVDRVKYVIYRGADGGIPEPIRETHKTHFIDREASRDSQTTLWTYYVTALVDGQETLVSNPAAATFAGASCVWFYPGIPPDVIVDPDECVPPCPPWISCEPR